ncbi:hypothetical protein COLO4_07590 [Corchorus olitorius]|uniref:Uncharacterized protein n=1 Tax=Corchorus olitorius TaxID=93759 RepID=A0A1R3KJ90_9ROSI|nr:hypothetical protein COLO4_07590 [Corchorus olitorius]
MAPLSMFLNVKQFLACGIHAMPRALPPYIYP